MEGEFDDALALANGSPVVPARPEDRRAPEDRRMPEGHWDPGGRADDHRAWGRGGGPRAHEGEGRPVPAPEANGPAPLPGERHAPASDRYAPAPDPYAPASDRYSPAYDHYAPTSDDGYSWIFDDREPTRTAGRPGKAPTAGTGLDDDARRGPYTPWDTAPSLKGGEPSPAPGGADGPRAPARAPSDTPPPPRPASAPVPRSAPSGPPFGPPFSTGDTPGHDHPTHHGRRTRHDHPAPTPWRTARGLAARAPRGPLPPVACPLGAAALGRTLAEPLTALTDLPSFDTSAMDGWAVAGPGPWHLAARSRSGAHEHGILAGQDASEAVDDGAAVPIATGARIPPGATAVLRSEHGEVRQRPDGGAQLYAPAPVPPGQDIRPRGQECRRGDQLLPAGALVTPAVLGLAAAAGYDELVAYARPRVEILVLGDELLDAGLPAEGRIRDALGPMITPWLRALGADAGPPRHLGDDADALYDALASSTADLVITTGGTASGPVDHVHPTLRRLGAEVLVDGVAVRPGHPMLLARLDADRLLVGLPGNPLAAVSGLVTLAEPALRTLAARRRTPAYRAPLTAAVSGHPHDTRLIPVAFREGAADDGDGGAVVPLRFSGPAMLRGIAAADAMAVVPPGGAACGGDVELLDLPWTGDGSAAEAVMDTVTDWTADAPARSGTDARRPGVGPHDRPNVSPTDPHPTGGGAA
ncbi:hypothetical protein DF17_06760 [Streptomyces rimosus]|nr:hypothetical protein DF17_06760 [Streptomyces rimosus]